MAATRGRRWAVAVTAHRRVSLPVENGKSLGELWPLA